MGVTFDGQFLILPQAAARIDETGLANINVDNGINIAIIGEAEGGQPNTLTTFTDITSVRRVHREGDIVEAALRAFAPSTANQGANRITTIRANPATQSTLATDENSAAVGATLLSNTAGPWDLADADTLVIDVDGGGDSTATFSATSATLTGSNTETFAITPGDQLTVDTDAAGDVSATLDAGIAVVPNTIAGTWALADGDTLDLNVNGSGTTTATFNATQGAAVVSVTGETYDFTGGGQTLDITVDGVAQATITFLVGDFGTPATASALEVATAINTAIGTVMTASDASGDVSIISDSFGTGSSIQVTGGTANALLNFSLVAGASGTGDAVDASAVTPTELKTLIDNDIVTVVVTLLGGNLIRIDGLTFGTGQTVEVEGTSVNIPTLVGLAVAVASGTGDVADSTAVTALEVLAVIATDLPALTGSNTAGAITLTSNTSGTGSSIDVNPTGALEAILGFSSVLVSGTGNVANIDAVTSAEVKAVVELAISGLTVNVIDATQFNVVSDTTGISSTLKVNATSTTEVIFGLDITLTFGNNAITDSGITYTSADWGLHTTFTRISIETGTTVGKKLILEKSGTLIQQDNVERSSFTIQYTGLGTQALYTSDRTTLTTTITGGPGGEDLNLLFTNYPTLQDLCDFIDTQTAYTCIITDTNPSRATNELDDVTIQDILTTTYTAHSDFQAILDTWNNGGFSDEIVATATGTEYVIPSDLAFTFLSGGSEGTLTNTEWALALTLLESADIKIFCLLSSDSGVHAMGDTHAQLMSGITNKKRRRQYAGGALGERTTNLSNYLTRASDLNSSRTSLVPFGITGTDSLGVATTFPPYIVAAQFAGLKAGLGVGEALTHKFITATGTEFSEDLPRAEKESLLEGGLLFPEEAPGDAGIRIVQGVTTWLQNNNFNRVEDSVQEVLDEVAETVEQRLDSEFIGSKADVFLLAAVVSRTESVLQTLANQGIIVGDAETPAFRNVTATLNGDVIEVSFEVSPAIPANFILVSVHAVPFSGTVTGSV